MFQDQWGNPVTAANSEAVEALDRTIMAYLGFRLDTGAHLKATMKADPEMPLGLIFSGFFFLLFCQPKMHVRGLAVRDTARAVVEGGKVSMRERHYMTALDSWAEGDWGRAISAFESILLDHPHDPMALRLSHYLHFYTSGGRAMRLSSARVLPFWTMDQPGRATSRPSMPSDWKRTGNTTPPRPMPAGQWRSIRLTCGAFMRGRM